MLHIETFNGMLLILQNQFEVRWHIFCSLLKFWINSNLSKYVLPAGVLAENVILLSLRLNPASFEINGKISLTSLDIDYGYREPKTFMNINGLYWSMSLFVCCTLSAISGSIFVAYLEVTQRVNFRYAERFDNTFYPKVSSLLSVTNEEH